MECPKCAGVTSIIDTRIQYGTPCRNRICEKCGYRFKTVEITENYYKFLKLVNKED